MNPHHASPSVDPGSGDAEWWRDAVVYQIYIRSFADADGDGTGDINGARHRLRYLADLGVDAIWVNPWYVSPLKDGGYDVADYRAIDDRYGTIDDAQAFIDEAKELGIRVIVDLVPNHCSAEHPWFQQALASAPGSPARDRFHFEPGRGTNGELPPNDWISVFGGPAWQRVEDGEWYLHIFDSGQPDLNWESRDVRAEFESILRFWLDRGVAGFRVDVAHALAKAPGYPDLGERPQSDGAITVPDHPFWDRDDVHAIIRSWRQILDAYDDRMMVAEAWVRAERRPLYVRPDEYHQAFDFDLLTAPWSASHFAQTISNAISFARQVGSSNTWVLSNHDVIRHVTRYGLDEGVDQDHWLLEGKPDQFDLARGTRRARAATLIVAALPGSLYMYQGEELGLPEVADLAEDVLDDPLWQNSGHQKKGRDGCRVPIPWEPAGPSLGFGTGTPWLPQPESFRRLAVAEQAGDPDSMLELYRSALRLRRELWRGDARFRLLDLQRDTLAFERGDGVACIANMGSHPVPLPSGAVLLSSASGTGHELAPDASVWIDLR